MAEETSPGTIFIMLCHVEGSHRQMMRTCYWTRPHISYHHIYVNTITMMMMMMSSMGLIRLHTGPLVNPFFAASLFCEWWWSPQFHFWMGAHLHWLYPCCDYHPLRHQHVPDIHIILSNKPGHNATAELPCSCCRCRPHGLRVWGWSKCGHGLHSFVPYSTTTTCHVKGKCNSHIRATKNCLLIIFFCLYFKRPHLTYIDTDAFMVREHLSWMTVIAFVRLVAVTNAKDSHSLTECYN